ncbi:MAG: 3-oxo-tetronate kinase [Rhodomicrobium sp.]
MSIILGCIADDYTGASDLANTLTRNGLRTIQTIGIPRTDLAMPEIDAVVIAMKIRSIAAGEAVAAARAANRWLQQRGVDHVLYKICSTFDSTDAGNIGPITEALRNDANTSIVLVTPAFPDTLRTVYLGNLFVGLTPLNESPMKDHPLNPMRDANLVRVLGRQSRGKVGLAGLFIISEGPARLRARLNELAATGHVAAIADAVFERDLEVIGEVAAQEKFSTGASGLGLGLARALVRTGRVVSGQADASEVLRPVGGFSAIVAGSCSKATLEQIEFAEKSIPVLRLDAEQLADEHGEDEIKNATSWACERIAARPVLITTSAEPDAVARIQQKHGRDHSGHAIEQAMASIAKALLDAGVRRLIVAGGETSGAVVDRLGIPAFQVGPEIAPGVPVLRSLGHGKLELLMALKSGNFGGPDFFEKALSVMK